MSYLYVSYIKIVLCFISMLDIILKKSVWNMKTKKWKYKNTWFLYVKSKKGFLEFPTEKKTPKQNKECANVICLNWRSEIVTRNVIMTMFLSVSYDYVFEYCSF